MRSADEVLALGTKITRSVVTRHFISSQSGHRYVGGWAPPWTPRGKFEAGLSGRGKGGERKKEEGKEGRVCPQFQLLNLPARC